MSLEEQIEPIFQARDSLLTEWKESKVCENYRTIYKISSLISFYFLVRWAVIDLWWRKNQNVIEYLEIIWMGFDGIPQLILIWIVMSFAVLLVYSCILGFGFGFGAENTVASKAAIVAISS
jgi:hypothetical protein